MPDEEKPPAGDDKEITDKDIFGDLEGDDEGPSEPSAGDAGEESPYDEDYDTASKKFVEKEPIDPRPLILKLLSCEGNRYEFEIGKASQGGYIGLLRQYLLRDDRVKFAAYKYDYFKPPTIRLELAEGVKLSDVVTQAAELIKQDLEQFSKALIGAF
ncbi:MAG: RpoL/Rpb11 RNA polymerase subunit family protein [Promethearchaeota archaeon]